MASGIVGGTKSKVSGTVGNQVYSLRRNADGTYSQVVATKAESVAYSNTEKQAAQRMATAMVEGLMRDLTPVANISMQSGANKSKSLNAFSAYNLNRVRDDMIANWYGGQKFVYPVEGSDVKLGGEYLISSGTLQLMQGEKSTIGYSDSGWGADGQQWFNRRVNAWVGFQRKCLADCKTLGDLLSRNNMLRSDIFVSVCNREYFIENTETEEMDVSYKYDYVIAKLVDTLPDSLSLEYLANDNCWQIQTNADPIYHYCPEANLFTVGLGIPFDNYDDHILYYANFLISRRDGSKRISNSSFRSYSGDSGSWLLNAAPSNVFYSWMHQPYQPSWPSPYV